MIQRNLKRQQYSWHKERLHMGISEIQEERGMQLPKRYVELLSGLGNDNEYCFNDAPEELPEFEGRWWSFVEEEQLSDPVEILRVGTAPVHRQLELFMRMFREFSCADAVESPEGGIAIERVSDGFVIAQENTDLLYLDPQDNFSVWVFYNDGYDVKKVAPSIEAWLDCAKTE